MSSSKVETIETQPLVTQPLVSQFGVAHVPNRHRRSLKTLLWQQVIVFGPVVTLIIGMVAQSVCLPFWINSFSGHIGGPYFILCWASLLFTICFGLMYVITLLLRGVTHITLRKYLVNFVFQGLANALNGIFVVYSSPIVRTPPILFLVIGYTGIIFGIIFTRLITLKRPNYRHWSPITSLILMFLAISVMVIGNLITNIHANKFTYLSIMWIGCATIGNVFGALYNVLQQHYLTNSNKELPTRLDQVANFITTLFWTSIIQLICMAILFEVDLIPGFGYSTWQTFITNFKASFLCFIGSPCDYHNAMFGCLFTVGYITTYISTIVLNKDSANFAIYASTIGNPVATVIFIATKLGTESTPLWAVIPSIALVVVGCAIWKQWEQSQPDPDDPINSSQLTLPTHEASINRSSTECLKSTC